MSAASAVNVCFWPISAIHRPSLDYRVVPSASVYPSASPLHGYKKGAEAPILVPHVRLDQTAVCFLRCTAIPTRPNPASIMP